MSRTIFSLLLIISLNACESDNSYVSYDFLTSLVKNKYEILFLRTESYQLDQLSHKYDAIKLKEHVNELLENGFEVESVVSFENYAFELIEYYGIYDSIPIPTIPASINKYTRVYIRYIEWIAINVISNNLFLNTLDVNWIVPQVIYDPSNMHLNDSFQANIFLASNNVHTPIEVIIDGDTIKERDPSGIGYIFKYQPSTLGIYTHNGHLILNHHDGKYKFNFQIEYDVKQHN